MTYQAEFQSNNANLQSILDTIKLWKNIPNENPSNFTPTNSGQTNYKSKVKDNNIDLQDILDSILLIDFKYTKNNNNTLTLTDWKGTYSGIASTRVVIPDNPRIIL